MLKKIFFLFLALILIFNFTLKDYAEAAIASKAASTAAKQIAKEYIRDKAIETAANYAVMEAMDIADKYQAKQGYKVVCPDGTKTCDKPIQVKQNITETDKQAIKGQVGTELDKSITNGKGLSRWQKFLDWFLPVWLVSFAATAITYAMDGEVRELFNEAGYNALVALGIISPVDTLTPKPLQDQHDEIQNSTDIPESNKIIQPQRYIFNLNMPIENTITMTSINLKASADSIKDRISHKEIISTIQTTDSKKIAVSFMKTSIKVTESIVPVSTVAIAFDGNVVASGDANSVGIALPSEISILSEKIQSVMTRAPYKVGNNYYTDTLFNTPSGAITVQVASPEPLLGQTLQHVTIDHFYEQPYSGVQYDYKTTVIKDISPYKRIYLAPYEEIAPTYNGKSSYENADGKVALVPPAALTYQDETTGETLQRVPGLNGEGLVFQKPDGTPVPEENVVANPVPDVVKNPEGVPEYTPSPTPSNPTPTPEPLVPAPTPSTPTDPHPNPNPTQPPGTTPPGSGTDEPPAEPFPDGEKCMETLKFPIFSPLKETFTTAFPFSIPWDIGRAIEAAFGDIGMEKPEYEIKIDTAGVNQTFKITTPAFFDKWKPFTDSFLVFTFDVLIMFGIFRFVKGAGS